MTNMLNESNTDNYKLQGYECCFLLVPSGIFPTHSPDAEEDQTCV